MTAIGWGYPSLELIGDLVDASLGARFVLLATRRSGHADRADDLVAGLDRQSALRRDDPRQVHRAGCGIEWPIFTPRPLQTEPRQRSVMGHEERFPQNPCALRASL